ncbi:hypothetical protein IW140_004359 [Coemansia sp. RSA 1813]|nr:hypothetical protein EV178_004430 [Coemansia sp. RSA 1646]KAJ1768456.1 hypothetical protein LPJ74_004845 [Coemansia sp. RSA 1843]KAJ2087919.1 hypothetical protein IW138_004617 [Coemansia sp. RSA 986]KAJ2212885.1 hypothetical protein EV179_004286 [Coemansia sp. RSA 487]KAJ2567656.1 hypothetical protein IW140_004359 [Coemansia sp. RSA 1813]
MDIREITDASLLSDKHRSHHCSWPDCRKGFTRKSDLKRHYRIHTNEKPYACTYAECAKRFVQKSALTVHLRTHSGEKPHCCKEPNCGKRFSDSSSLARHRHTHSGKRTYLCSFAGCNKQFYTKSAYNSHHRGHMDSLSRPAGSLGSRLPAVPALALPCRATRSDSMSSVDSAYSSAPATPPMSSGASPSPAVQSPSPSLAPETLPPLHEYLGVLSKAASVRLPLPTAPTHSRLPPLFPSMFAPLTTPSPSPQLYGRSALPPPRTSALHTSAVRFTPY